MKDRPIRVLALAGTLVVLLLSSVLAARPEPALPAEMPASERSRLAAVTATASLATHAAGEPFVARREVFEYLLDHPEFAAHLTPTLRSARRRIRRQPRRLRPDPRLRTARAIEHDPAGVHELLRLRPDVSRPELKAFRQLLRLP